MPGYFYERVEPVLETLLDAAAESGEMRTDISARDLLQAIAQLSQSTHDAAPEYSRRMVALLVDGLRQGAPA